MRRWSKLTKVKPGAALLALLAAMSCSLNVGPQSDGGDVSVVDNKICGTIHAPQGDPAAGATVYLRSAGYLTGDVVLAKRNAAPQACTTITDGQGKFTFSKQSVGRADVFTIEARGADSQTVLFIDSMVIDSALFASNTWLNIDTPHYATTLAPPCTVAGTVRKASGSLEGTVRVFGLDAGAELDEDGNYIITNLPAGQLRLEIRYKAGDTVHTGIVSVAADPEKTASVTAIANVAYVNGDDGTAAEDVWKNAGDTIIVDTPQQEKAGSVFTGWNSEADGSGTTFLPGDTLIVDTVAVSLHAQWKEVWYSLDVQSTGHGTVTAPDSAGHGVPVILHAVPDDGYEVRVWRVKEGSAILSDSVSDSTTVILKDGDAVVEAEFGVITFRKKIGDLKDTMYMKPYIDKGDDGYICLIYVIPPLLPDSENGILCIIRMIRTDLKGNVIWTKNVMQKQVATPGFCDPVKLTDGNYMLYLSDGDNAFISVVENSGSVVSERTISTMPIPDTYRGAVSVRNGDDGLIYQFRESPLYGRDENSFWAMKINQNGDVEWSDTLIMNKMYSLIDVREGDNGNLFYFFTHILGVDSTVILQKKPFGEVLATLVLPGVISNGNGIYDLPDNAFNLLTKPDESDSFQYTITKISYQGTIESYTTFSIAGLTSSSAPVLVGETPTGTMIFTFNSTDGSNSNERPFIEFDENGQFIRRFSYSNANVNEEYRHYTDYLRTDPYGGYTCVEGTTLLNDDWMLYLVKTDENGEVHH